MVIQTASKLPHKLSDLSRHTTWHKFKHKFRIGNVAASTLVLTDFKAHGRVRARYLIYNRILYTHMNHCFPRQILPNSAGQFAKFRGSPRPIFHI